MVNTGEIPSSNPQDPRERVLTVSDIYYTFAAGLRLGSEYINGAYTLTGDIGLTLPDGSRRPGRYVVSDYHAYNAVLINTGSPPTPGEQWNMLLSGATPINASFYHARTKLAHVIYDIFWPDTIRSGEKWHDSLKKKYGESGEKQNGPQEAPELLIYCLGQGMLSDTITEPGRDHHLRSLFDIVASGISNTYRPRPVKNQ